MDLRTYLTKSFSRPNKQILQSLGATEEQIEYIMETPENFNWNVWSGLEGGSENGSGSSEAKYVIKLARYGSGPEIYAEDSPQKPTKDEFYNDFISMYGEAEAELKKMGYNSIEEAGSTADGLIDTAMVLSSLIDKYYLIYNISGQRMYSWADMWLNTANPADRTSIRTMLETNALPESSYTEVLLMAGVEHITYQPKQS